MLNEPKDYVEYYRERFTSRDIDDARINGFLFGAGFVAVAMLLIYLGCTFIPIL